MKNKSEQRKEKVITVKNYGAGSVEAVWAADFLYTKITKTGLDYLIPSYSYTLCSIIEENLNCLLIDFFYSKFGDKYKEYVAVYLKMTIHDKLKIVIPTISEFKYDLNHTKEEIIVIRQLFEIRNQLIHIKNHYYLAKFIKNNDGQEFMEELDEKQLNIYSDKKFEKLNKEKLLGFLKAQKAFTPFIHRLHSRIKRKDFKPADWLIQISN